MPMKLRVVVPLVALAYSVTAEEYQYVKLQSSDSTDGTQFCVGELELYDSYRKISLTEYESCSASSTSDDTSCENAFQGNGDADLGFCSDPSSSLISAGTELDGANGYLMIYMRPGDDVTKFKLTALEDGGADLAPTSFQLLGSNGGGDWTVLYDADGVSWEDGETQTFFVEGSCDAINRWGVGDEDHDETCAGRGYSQCTGAFSTWCEWKEESYFDSCLAILLDGTTESGMYELLVGEEFVWAYCDMSIGGWTRILNVPSDTPQTDILQSTDAFGFESDGTLANTDGLYKLADSVINAVLGEDTVFQYRCGSVDYFVSRDGGWITAIDETGWQIDRDMDGTPDCAADRTGYLFSDYNEDDVSPLDGASIDTCGTVGHTDFGFADSDGSELGCYNSEDDWGNQAQVYVRGMPADQFTIESCADLQRSDWTGIYLTQYGALYCNQDLEGGGVTGGWTLLMKTTTSGSLFEYDADYWTVSNTLNGDSLFTYYINFQPQQAKLETFNGDHAGYKLQFNEYLAYWPGFDSGDSTWYIGTFESLTALEFFQTTRTISNDAASEDSFNGDYFSSESSYGVEGICYTGADDDTAVRWGYIFAGSDDGQNVNAMGGVGLDSMGFTNGLSSGDSTLTTVESAASNSGVNSQTSYEVQLYGRAYTGDTYDDCSALPSDADSGLYYTSAVWPIYCDNDLEAGGWTLVLKTIGSDTEFTYTGNMIDDDTVITKDPPIDSVNTDTEDAKFEAYSTLAADQFLFYYPDSDTYFITDYLATMSTAQEYLSTYDTYQDSAPLNVEPTLVYARQYFDGGVCTRSTQLDCTVKYMADNVVDNILTFSPAPAPSNVPTFTSNGYEAVGSSCNTYNTISEEDGGYTTTGSIGASIIFCGDKCDIDDSCLGFQLSRTSCILVGDTSEATPSSNGDPNLAVTGGDICYRKVDALYTTAPPPMWDAFPETVYLGADFNGWGLWDDDATEDWQYCADAVVTSSCDSMTLEECLTMCEGDDSSQYCSYGAFASSGFTENDDDGELGGSECCIATSTCNQLTTSTESQAAHYAIYEKLTQQTSEYRACSASTDCNEAYYCAAFLLQAKSGSASAELFLGTEIADTMVMCMPCVDATDMTCSDWGDAIDSCDTCSGYALAADMPVIERECGLDQYVNPTTGECGSCTTSCSEGYYISGDRCTGVETSDPVECIACTSSCGLGQYMVGTCDGSGTSDSVECVDCVSACSEGEFIDDSAVTETSACNGQGTQTPVCSPCTSRCNMGFYLDGVCDGTGTENDVTCVECQNTCDAGQYVDNVCSGLGFSDDTACVDCKSECASDEYIVGECDGTQSHDSIYCAKCQMICVDGQYYSDRCDGTTKSDPLTCFDCTTECSDGEFMQGTCDGNTDTDDVVCISCDECEPGVLQNDGFNCEATCIGAVIAAVEDADDGQLNVVSGPMAFIGAGAYNDAVGQYSVIATGTLNVASGYGSVIGGGHANSVLASASYSVIGGGESNKITSPYGVIGAGTGNQIVDASDYSTIGAGYYNYIEGEGNVILSGQQNTIIGSTSKSNVIAGGQYNTIEGKFTTILGGKNCYANGNYATILGGSSNVIMAGSNFAVIAGGNKNTVEGKQSLAIGSKAETRAASSATFGFSKNTCETRAERVVNFCADEVAINGEPVLTLFVSRRRELEEEEEMTLKGLSAVIFNQEAELEALDAEMDQVLDEINALMALESGNKQ